MKLKVCGMKFQENIEQVANLQPDFLGFIFYENSKRNFIGLIPDLPDGIKKIGVFVDADIAYLEDKIETHQLDAVQLHGDESPMYCQSIKGVEIIKVFSIGNSFDFSRLNPYENVCDYFLFDTKGKEKGGNGLMFDWKLLEKYPSKKPFFLSGGIGLEEIRPLKSFFQNQSSAYCFALDINSRFELEPGLKKIELIKEFKQSLKSGEGLN